MDQKTSQYLVTTICLMQHHTSPLHRVDHAVDCGLWNGVPLLFNSCAKLLYIGWNWNTVVNADPEYPKHAQWLTCLVKKTERERECSRTSVLNPTLLNDSIKYGSVWNILNKSNQILFVTCAEHNRNCK